MIHTRAHRHHRRSNASSSSRTRRRRRVRVVPRLSFDRPPARTARLSPTDRPRRATTTTTTTTIHAAPWKSSLRKKQTTNRHPSPRWPVSVLSRLRIECPDLRIEFLPTW